MKRIRWIVLLGFACFFCGLGGCATEDPDNVSARPWNAPQDGWESGLPAGGGLYDERR